MLNPGDRITRSDRGGNYEFLGIVRGAGTQKGSAMMCYRDLDTGALLMREPENFAYRMRPVLAEVSHG